SVRRARSRQTSHCPRADPHSCPTRRSSDLGNGHDPAVWLASGLREHRLLTDPDAVALRLMTHSWTNARSARLSGLDHDIVTTARSEEHTSALQSREKLVCRPLLGKKTFRLS